MTSRSRSARLDFADLAESPDRLGSRFGRRAASTSRPGPRQEAAPPAPGGRDRRRSLKGFAAQRPRQADHGLRHRQDLHLAHASPSELVGAGRRPVLFLVPSISLLSPDAARVDGRGRAADCAPFAVCSDAEVGKPGPEHQRGHLQSSTSPCRRPPTPTAARQALRTRKRPQRRDDRGVLHLPVHRRGRPGPEARACRTST